MGGDVVWPYAASLGFLHGVRAPTDEIGVKRGRARRQTFEEVGSFLLQRLWRMTIERLLRGLQSLVASFLAGMAILGCGGAPPPPPPVLAPPMARIPAGQADTAAMLTEMLAIEYCDQARGRFLPIAYTRGGRLPRGDEPVGGRWWVRDCRARVFEGQLALFLDGVGWAWAEGEEDFLIAGWRTAEYAFFAAGGTVVGPVDVDLAGKRLWIRFQPRMMPYVSSTPTNRVTARGNFGADVLSLLTLGFLGKMADDSANETVERRLATVFTRKLGAGFELWFDVQHRQRDLVTSDAVTPPIRPFSDGIRWLVNERQVFHSGGVHVNGPYALTQTAGVDFRVLYGTVRYRVECERDVVAWLDPVASGVAPSLPPPAHAQAEGRASSA